MRELREGDKGKDRKEKQSRERERERNCTLMIIAQRGRFGLCFFNNLPNTESATHTILNTLAS